MIANAYRAIEVVGHQMKGSGAGYGFPALTDLGSNLEVAAKATAQDAVQAQIRVLAEFLLREESVRAADEISIAL